MTIAEKVIEENKDSDIFVLMDIKCPSDYGFSDICECNINTGLEGQKECLKCWTREIET